MLAAWSRLPQQVPGSEVVLVTPQLDLDALSSCREKGGQIRVLLDPGGRTAHEYNALWSPRAYAIDEYGILCYAQPASTPDAQAPRAVRALWGSG